AARAYRAYPWTRALRCAASRTANAVFCGLRRTPGRERSPVRPPGPRALRCAEESQFLPRISAFAGGGAAQASVGDQPTAAGMASGCTFCAAGVKGATSWVQVAPSVASRSMRYCSIAASAHELGVMAVVCPYPSMVSMLELGHRSAYGSVNLYPVAGSYRVPMTSTGASVVCCHGPV